MRNIPILIVAQAVGMSGLSMLVLLGGIIATDLAPTPALATLPISLMVVGVAVFTIPAALIMKKTGRRAGFSAASVFAAGASLVAVLALARGSFTLFCLSSMLIGANGAFGQQYRFAAIESVAPRQAGKAVSFLLVGGILSGFLGPEIARRTKDWSSFGEYTGAFFTMAILYTAVAILLLFLKDIRPQESEERGEERPLQKIALQPIYLVALLSSSVSFGVMSLIMTATPVHLHNTHHYDFNQTALIIQSHVIAMFLPSLFTGFLLEKVGVLRVMATGVLFMFASILLSLAGYDFMLYWGALVLLGIGWNFMFVAGTVLLTHSYLPRERFKAQAANDFTVFGVQAFSSLSAGTILHYASWDSLQLATLPFLLLALAATIQLRRNITAELSRIKNLPQAGL